MLLDDVLKIVGSYLDLSSYKQLIPVYPKIFTETEYKTYQTEYEIFFSQNIKEQWDIKNNVVLEMINSNKNKKKIEALLIKNQQQMLDNFAYALEYCNIFVAVTPNNTQTNTENTLNDRFFLFGYLNSTYYPDLSLFCPVKITCIPCDVMKKGVDMMILSNSTTFSVTYKMSDTMYLFKLYSDLTAKYKSTLIAFKGNFLCKILNIFNPNAAKLLLSVDSSADDKESNIDFLGDYKADGEIVNNSDNKEDNENNEDDENEEDAAALRAYRRGKINNNNTN